MLPCVPIKCVHKVMARSVQQSSKMLDGSLTRDRGKAGAERRNTRQEQQQQRRKVRDGLHSSKQIMLYTHIRVAVELYTIAAVGGDDAASTRNNDKKGAKREVEVRTCEQSRPPEDPVSRIQSLV